MIASLDSKRCITAIIFCSFCLTIPTFAWIPFGWGSAPVWVWFMTIFSGGVGGILVGGFYFFIWGAILFWLAHCISTLLIYFCDEHKTRFLCLTLILFGLFLLALSPVYKAGHIKWLNLPQIFTDVFIALLFQ